jgi:type I restriction enzyme S subunit
MRDDWIETTFETFASLEKGISYKSSELCDEGEGLPFINLKSIDRGGGYRPDGLKWYSGKFKSSQVVEPGDLILCCTDLTKQKAILGFPILVPNIGHSRFCISLDLAKIIVDEELILKSFLFLLLQDRRMREFMQSRSSGTTVMHLKTSEVPDVRVALPPLPEQKRIVDLISSVDSYIEALQQQLESARKSRNAVLHQLLTAGGDDWTETALGELINLSTGKLDVNAGKANGEYPFFTCAKEIYWINEHAFEGEAVLVAGNGDLNVKYYDGKFNAYQRTYVLFSKNSQRLAPRFLFLFMSSYINELRNSTQGSTIQYLKKNQFIDAEISLPPFPEQERIVDLISSMDDGISATEKLISQTKQMRSGLLSDLLSGEHEIPPSYDKVIGAA